MLYRVVKNKAATSVPGHELFSNFPLRCRYKPVFNIESNDRIHKVFVLSYDIYHDVSFV